jgi:hypothetical protein
MLAEQTIDTKPYHLFHHTDIDPVVLSDIYQDEVNFVSWQRQLDENIEADISRLLENKTEFRLRAVLKPSEVKAWLNIQWSNIKCEYLVSDIATLAEMYCDLFAANEIGFRLELLDKTLCPYFHVDKVPARLVTTYHGPATEWVEQDNVNRTALEAYQQEAVVIDRDKVHQVSAGDVLLFKGEKWPDRKVESIVHRSPEATLKQRRLLLTLDLVGE